MARLILLGGGHAHLPLLSRTRSLTDRGHEVTLISPSPEHYYSGMGPGVLGGSCAPVDARFPVALMVTEGGGRFVRGRVVAIDPVARQVELSDGARIGYDVLSVNAGSGVARAFGRRAGEAGPRVFYVKPIEHLMEAREYLAARAGSGPLGVVVAGGGPAAVEVAANVRRLVESLSAEADRLTAIDLVAGRDMLPGFPRSAERVVRRTLGRRRVTVRAGDYVRGVTDSGVETDRGVLPCDLVIVATGVMPPRLFLESGMATGPDGGLAVNERLQALGHPEVFGGGDCIWFTPKPLARAGVYAVRQGPVLAHNVERALAGDHAGLRRFRPGGDYLLLLNLGDGTALFRRRVAGVPVVVRARWAWKLKDRIDRRFMAAFGVAAGGEPRVSEDGR